MILLRGERGERWRGRNIVVENFLIEVEAMLAGGFTLTKRNGILGLFICMYEHKVWSQYVGDTTIKLNDIIIIIVCNI